MPHPRRAAALLVMAVVCALGAPQHPLAQSRPRARVLGVPFHGTPGPLNAITDVAGVEVGHTTIVRGDVLEAGVDGVGELTIRLV